MLGAGVDQAASLEHPPVHSYGVSLCTNFARERMRASSLSNISLVMIEPSYTHWERSLIPTVSRQWKRDNFMQGFSFYARISRVRHPCRHIAAQRIAQPWEKKWEPSCPD
jgi:hypothetical protein